MKELAASVYNLLKTLKTMPMSVTNLLQKIAISDDHLEDDLSTMLQLVCGTNRYWFVRKSELQCIVRETGPPTLFLNFSCAEYEAPGHHQLPQNSQ